MSQLIKKPKQIIKNSEPKQLKLGVKDTDFLLRLIKVSTFNGEEIEQAYSVIQKLGIMHRSNLED
jgi:hypothetical protein|tara:strand:+ start:251 stop:445 length:195 start_codon:yes stop_codon:yes gene_type:complete